MNAARQPARAAERHGRKGTMRHSMRRVWRSASAQQRRGDRLPLVVERARCRRLARSAIPIAGVAGVAFLAVEVAVHPRALGRLDVLRDPVRALQSPVASCHSARTSAGTGSGSGVRRSTAAGVRRSHGWPVRRASKRIPLTRIVTGSSDRIARGAMNGGTGAPARVSGSAPAQAEGAPARIAMMLQTSSTRTWADTAPSRRARRLRAPRPGQCAADAQVTVAVDAAANRHPINPNVYGVAHAGTAELTDLNAPLNRYGGNTTTRYNWQLNADNRGNDWYFESIADSERDGRRARRHLHRATRSAAGAQPMLTIPMLDWVAKLGAEPQQARELLASPSTARRPATTGSGSPTPATASARNGAVRHRQRSERRQRAVDVRVPAGLGAAPGRRAGARRPPAACATTSSTTSRASGTRRTATSIRPARRWTRSATKMIDYAATIKAVDPGALVVGPEEWGWSGYFYSGYDQQYGSRARLEHAARPRQPRRRRTTCPGCSTSCASSDAATGQRLLDVFTVHYYPQGGEFGNDIVDGDAAAPQPLDALAVGPELRGRDRGSTTRVQLIPRLKSWVDTYYPGHADRHHRIQLGRRRPHQRRDRRRPTSSASSAAKASTWRARWTTPDAAHADLQGDEAVPQLRRQQVDASATPASRRRRANPDDVSAFAAERSTRRRADGDGGEQGRASAPTTVTLANSAHGAASEVWQLTSANAITRLADVPVSGGTRCRSRCRRRASRCSSSRAARRHGAAGGADGRPDRRPVAAPLAAGGRAGHPRLQ